MDTKIQQQLLNRASDFIDKAAKTLGQATAHVYQVLVSQQYVTGISTITEVIIMTLASIILVKPALWLWHQASLKDDKENNSGDYRTGAGILIVIIYLAMIILTIILGEAIKHLLNPEYYAIEFIFNQASDAINK